MSAALIVVPLAQRLGFGSWFWVLVLGLGFGSWFWVLVLGLGFGSWFWVLVGWSDYWSGIRDCWGRNRRGPVCG